MIIQMLIGNTQVATVSIRFIQSSIHLNSNLNTGEDYKQIPNDQKVQEIDNFPLLLSEIKTAIGDKELSIAVPGREVDMIAFTAEKVPEINKVVDHVNVRPKRCSILSYMRDLS
jgi:hypothetical protein